MMGHLNPVLFSPDDLKLVRTVLPSAGALWTWNCPRSAQVFLLSAAIQPDFDSPEQSAEGDPGKPSLASTLPVWDYQLAEAGSYIIQQRQLFSQSLQNIAREIHSRITNHSEALTMEYKSSIPFEEGSLQEIQEQFIRELETRHKDDIARVLREEAVTGMTSILKLMG